MSLGNNKFTITAALPYANGPLHIGHIAGAYLPADIFVRYLRLAKKDVAFICGSDEHGAAITLRAKKDGITPKEIIDKYHAINKKAFADFGISFDIFHRTSEPLHYKTAQDFFLELDKNKAFTIESSEQFYDEDFQQFLADRYVTGTCPKCNNPGAYGDQCEKCGSTLSPTELIDPKSTLSGKTPVLKQTNHWYLPMQDHQNWLEEWIKNGSFSEMENPIAAHEVDKWKANVKGQCLSWLSDGLRPRAMTRDLDWGVPVPLPNAEGKVLYVWLDAPIGYISATKQWAADNGKNWEDYWKNSDTKLIHFIGKDNIVFHSIVFPILLKAHKGFILPDNVPANEFLNLEGDKISTSRNHAVWLHEYLADFPEKQDELRYVLNAIAPENGDSEFTWKDYQTRVNSELVAILGNFINRVFVLFHKYFEGKVNAIKITDNTVVQAIEEHQKAIVENIENYKFRQAQFEMMDLARFGNKYLTENEPWKTFAENPQKTEEVLSNCIFLIERLAAFMQPFLPSTANKIYKMLNLEAQYFSPNAIQFNNHILNQPVLLFSKIEDAAIAIQLQKLADAKQANLVANSKYEAPDQKESTTFDDFQKMDIRVGTILEAEKMAKTKKLLKLLVDTGIDKRTIVSGIAEHFSPEEIIGQQVSILINLEPRAIAGIESQGMILMGEDALGKLYFIQPSIENAPNGAVIR